MRIKKPRDRTKRAVLARSGNQCAYPSCTAPIYDKSGMVGQLAHIKGAKLGSARHNETQPPEERHGEGNLIAMCNLHGSEVIDTPKGAKTYKVPALQKMKSDHEAKVEGVRDRSWIKPPNSVGGGSFGDTRVHFWVDRQGGLRIYNDDQLAQLSELLRLRMDFADLNTTMQALRTLNPQQMESLSQQSYARVGEDADNLLAHLTNRMSVAPGVTFGEFLHFIVEGNDATALIDLGAERRLDIIEGRAPSFWRNKGVTEGE